MSANGYLENLNGTVETKKCSCPSFLFMVRAKQNKNQRVTIRVVYFKTYTKPLSAQERANT